MNLGFILNKNEQQLINVGGDDPITDLCVSIPREVTSCLMHISSECCGLWD
ncbi:hypothetical protein ACIVBQ_000540 [Tenacibaculum discolor]